MDYTSFNYTLDMGAPPEDYSPELKALWWERKNYWDTAHKIIQHLPGKDAAWVHAYLHRKEGDIDNATHWYAKAGIPFCEKDINDEFRDIISVLMEKYSSES